MCRILKIRQNTASHSASAEYSAKLPNIRLRQPAEDYSVHPYLILQLLEENSVDRGGSDELSFNSVLHKNYNS